WRLSALPARCGARGRPRARVRPLPLPPPRGTGPGPLRRHHRPPRPDRRIRGVHHPPPQVRGSSGGPWGGGGGPESGFAGPLAGPVDNRASPARGWAPLPVGAPDTGRSGSRTPDSGGLGALTSLVGREGDLARLHALLDDPACRSVTLVGPVGIGKTRLALEGGAARGGRYRDGVVTVSFAGTSPARPEEAADLMVTILAAALGVSLAV